MPEILLVDNGSVRADATKQLRKLAQGLSDRAGKKIHPVSLRHANKIPAQLLEGEKAQIFQPFMQNNLAQGKRHFIILPLFFGESSAIESQILNYLSSLQLVFSDFIFEIADVVYPLPKGESLLADIIYDHITATAHNAKFVLENIVLVDHGSPCRKVTAVRQHLAQSIEKKYPINIKIEQAVMERREGEKYLFNGELLKDWLIKKAKLGKKTVIVSLLFFLAGRHAGRGGDIEKICHSVMAKHPDFKIAICPLVSEHDLLLSVLYSRLLSRIDIH